MLIMSGVPASEGDSGRLSMARSYGTFTRWVESRFFACAHILVLAMALTAAPALAASPDGNEAKPINTSINKPIKIVVLGDSLSAGLGLSGVDAFPAKLQKALIDKGINVDISNAGV